MAQQPPPIHFEDIPLAEARTMGRGSQVDPELYHAFAVASGRAVRLYGGKEDNVFDRRTAQDLEQVGST